MYHFKGCSMPKFLELHSSKYTITYCPECFVHERINRKCEHDFEPVLVGIRKGTSVRKLCKKCNFITPNAEKQCNYNLSDLRNINLEEYRKSTDYENLRLFNFEYGLEEDVNLSGHSNYDNYLHGSWWTSRRIDILKRDNGICQLCGDPAKVVHHMEYLNKGNERDFELVSLCEDCHKKYHPD